MNIGLVPDGEISTTYNCIDRHVESGRGDNVAIIWESPVTSTKRNILPAALGRGGDSGWCVCRRRGP